MKNINFIKVCCICGIIIEFSISPDNKKRIFAGEICKSCEKRILTEYEEKKAWLLTLGVEEKNHTEGRHKCKENFEIPIIEFNSTTNTIINNIVHDDNIQSLKLTIKKGDKLYIKYFEISHLRKNSNLLKPPIFIYLIFEDSNEDIMHILPAEYLKNFKKI